MRQYLMSTAYSLGLFLKNAIYDIMIKNLTEEVKIWQDLLRYEK